MSLHFCQGGNEYKANFSWIANDYGPGQIEIPFNTPLAQWIHDTIGSSNHATAPISQLSASSENRKPYPSVSR